MAVQGEKKLAVSIYDYPEHLNPFHENDHKYHFWNLTKLKPRRSSFSDGFKEFKRTWSFRSFTKKGRRNSKYEDSASVSGAEPDSPIMYRSALGRATMSRAPKTAEEINKYYYGGSTTPLPRFRFQERGSVSDYKQVDANGSTTTLDNRRTSAPGGSSPTCLPPTVNGVKPEHRGSLTSLQSNNPFDTSVGSVRSSARKKRRAPPPPPKMNPIHDTPCITVTDPSLNTTILEEKLKQDESNTLNEEDFDLNHPSLNTELKIIEDVEKQHKEQSEDSSTPDKSNTDKCKEEGKTVIVTEELVIEEEVPQKPENKDQPIDVTNDEDLKNTAINIAPEKPEDIKIVVINKDENSQKTDKETVTQYVKDNQTNEDLLEKDNTESESNAKDNKEINDNIKENDCVKDVTDTTNFEVSEEDLIKQKTSLSDDTDDDVFKKVDIIIYKKQQSLNNDINNGDSKDPMESNGNEVNNIETDKTGTHTVTEGSVVVVKCGYIEYPEKTDIIKENARRRSEFFDIDKAVKEIENIEIRDKTTVENGNYQRRRVSDMKLLFDNPGINDPSLVNPIPKPRRVRSTSKTSTTESSPSHNDVSIVS